MEKINNKSPEYDIEFNSQGKGSQRKGLCSKHQIDTLEGQLRFERFLLELTAKFIDLPADQIDNEIEAGLKLIVGYLGVDRGTLSEFSRDGRSLIATHTYSTFGIKKVYAKRLHLKVPSYTAKIRQGDCIIISRAQEIPEEWTLEKAYQKEAGIKSSLGFPLKVGGGILGALTFDALRSEMSWSDRLIKQLSIFSDIFGNVLARKRASIQIKEDMEFEALISQISNRFLSLPANEIDTGIEKSLQQIVKFLRIDRSSIFQYSGKENIHYLTHYWAREEIPPLIKDYTNRDFPWLAKELREGKTISYSRIGELPADAVTDIQSLQEVGTKSLLAIPFMVTGKWLGVLSLDAVLAEKVWPKKIFQRGKLIGEIFANTLKRKESELNLKKAFSEIKQLKNQIEADYNYLREEIDSEHGFHEIIGDSAPLKHVLFKIDQVAPTETTVLILGETGTGKELVARAVHNRSRRKDRPMVKVNCAALSPMLIESELFGHEKGAYTGAHNRKIGRFETANGSSFFLDEIGELPFELQAKLLRVIQDGEFERMGSSQTKKVDVRIIAATNRDLEDEVREGRFRRDLLYRLNVFPITIPPLRKRKDDIPLLVEWFVQIYSKKLGKPIKIIPKSIMADLRNYMWPGNIRELENTIERAVINTRGSTLQLLDISNATWDDLTPPLPKGAPAGMGDQVSTIPKTTLPEMKRHFTEKERKYIIQVLQETNWRVEGPKGAALILGLQPSTLRSRMKKLGIQKKFSLK